MHINIDLAGQDQAPEALTLAGVEQALDYLNSFIVMQQAKAAKMQNEYNEIRDAYMEVSEKNTQQAKQLTALRIAVRELAGKDPAPTNPPGTTEAAQEAPKPKGTPEKSFEERRGCDCGCGVSVTILKEDELPVELQEILKQLRSRMK